LLDTELKNNLTANAKVTASAHRGNVDTYAAPMAIDENPETYWTTDDNVTTGYIEVELNKPRTVKYIQLQEYIKLGQRVKSFKVEAWDGDAWKSLSEATTIGYKRILKLEPIETNKLKITILASKACPLISDIKVF
jgi:alpha-L-fucosidase